MPLINLRTNLKTTTEYTSTDPNLTYGHDRKDFGSSNQPYIVTPIPEGNDNVRSSPDFLLRNGYLNTINSLNDVKRISKFFTDNRVGNLDFFPFQVNVNLNSINGLLFVTKQELLERQNVKVVNGFNRIYNPLGTIAQVGVLSSGYHLNKQGFNVFKRGYYNDGQSGYYYITKNDSTINGGVGINRLVSLFNIKQNLLATNTDDVQGRDRYDISLNSNILLSYSGGPGSILGIGKTNIRIQNPLAFKTNTPRPNNSTTFSYPIEKTPETYLAPDGANVTKIFKTPFSGYGNFSETKTNTYKTSQTSFDRKRKGVDKIFNPNLSISPDQDFTEGDDIIDFSFTLINNEGINATDPNPNTFINFRAYIDDFSDSYTGDWDSYRYMGRAENFYRYKGFTREMSVSFTVPVLSRADMVTIYQKLNALTWLTMPDYSDVGIMRGNLAYFTMGDYLRRSIVVVKSLNYTPIMEMGFDINRTQDGTAIEFGTSEYVGQLPKGMRVTANIIPLTNAVSPNSPDNFYTPQRGEAFIGNRTHAVVDRNNISTQYNETLTPPTDGEPYVANNPNSSPLITITSPPSLSPIDPSLPRRNNFDNTLLA